MRLHLPETVEQAVALLAADPEARCLAGGQTLVAMMNARLVAPTALVGLRRVASLQGIEIGADGGARIGAMTPHDEVQRDARLVGSHAILRLAAARIAHPAVRNFGTIGGSIANADPAADYPAAVVAAAAEIEIAGPDGVRRVPARSFFTDYMETALRPGELVAAVRLPPVEPDALCHYEKFSLVDGDYAVLSVAAVLAMEGGACRFARLALGGCGPTPMFSEAAEQALAGTTLDESDIAAAAATLAEAADPVDDVRGSADYRRRLIPRLVRRAVRSALDSSPSEHDARR